MTAATEPGLPSSRSRTASSSRPSRPSRPRPPASSSRTPPRRSPRRASSSPSAPAASRTATACPLDVNEGDSVIYCKYGGTEVKYAGEEYLILSARDVLAVVEK